MKMLALILTLLFAAQPAVFAASVCVPGPASCGMSCCKEKCCCGHHATKKSDDSKSAKNGPIPGCSLGCSNPAASFSAPIEKNPTTVSAYTPAAVPTELFGRLPDRAMCTVRATSPPRLSLSASAIPLRI